MRLNQLKLVIIIFIHLLVYQPAQAQELYKNAKNPIPKRVDDLLKRMTLKEKIMQLNQYTEGDNDNPNNIEKSVNNLSPEIGSLIFSSSDPVFRNKIQKKALEESRLGIPILFAFDVIHGYKTIYPIPLGQAASWNLDLAEKTAGISAKETRLGGIEWTFSPMIDVAYDARWGRVAEGYGEDPYTNAQFGIATVLGYQGRQPYDSLHVAACLKHYIGYSRSEGGRDYVYTDISPQAIWETYMPPYIATVNAGAATIMSSFNDISGTPSTANVHWLKDVLRTQLGFNGVIVSDWYGIDQLKSQGVAKDDKEATYKAFIAGTDIDMVDNLYGNNLEQLLKEKKITINQIDEAVRRVLKLKFELGLFEKPYVNILPDEKRFLLPEDVKVVEKYAEESMVLLKNKDKVLPVENVTNIALIGPFAKDNENVLGSWRAFGKPKDVVPFYDGIIKEFGARANFEYVKGCDFDGNDKSEFDAAYQTALKSDIVILYLGERASWSGENASRSTLALPTIQEDLVKHIANAGKKIILVLSSGRPVELSRIEPLVDGIIAVWQPGTAGSAPLAGIISGRINPSGKLPITFPYSTGQIPIFYNHRQSARTTQGHYQDIPAEPLYPFAHGLSYTTFEYSSIKLSEESIGKNDKITATITVKNTGNKDGLETVHWYIRDLHASISRPVKELKFFEKKSIKVGETATYTFEIDPIRDLSFPDATGKRLLESGEFQLKVVDKEAKFILK